MAVRSYQDTVGRYALARALAGGRGRLTRLRGDLENLKVQGKTLVVRCTFNFWRSPGIHRLGRGFARPARGLGAMTTDEWCSDLGATRTNVTHHNSMGQLELADPR